MNKVLASSMLLLCAAGGCSQTVSAHEFLSVYRRGGQTAAEQAGISVRLTKDESYHYLDVRLDYIDSDPWQLFLHGSFEDKHLRCPINQLPEDFPEGFRTLFEDGITFEPQKDTDRYIQQYLARSSREGAHKHPSTDDDFLKSFDR